MALPEYPIMSVEDYLILDRGSKENRYEYFDGDGSFTRSDLERG